MRDLPAPPPRAVDPSEHEVAPGSYSSRERAAVRDTWVAAAVRTRLEAEKEREESARADLRAPYTGTSAMHSHAADALDALAYTFDRMAREGA